ncbi:MAG: alkaline phosphatase family protein [Gemmatimonadetes bacterium]|nr:alkaline phosphatase family protein [Gemmatimonadota bacterium]
MILVFADGVGLGARDAAKNPFMVARVPVMQGMLEGAIPVAETAPLRTMHASLLGLDATLGVAGTPQSGTGQTALFTGRNAAAQFGRHFGPWVPAGLRALLREENVLVAAQRAGRMVAFANAYPEELFALPVPESSAGPGGGPLPSDAGRRMRAAPQYLDAGPPMAALAAGVLTRHTDALAHGDAVASEITNDGWRMHLGRTDLPDITARDAGHNLARIGAQHHLTLFAHYSTDYAGHSGQMDRGIDALERLDAFLGGLRDSQATDCAVVLTSDHGNIEDVTTGHTRNPAIALVFGHRHDELSAGWSAITDIAPGILDCIGKD